MARHPFANEFIQLDKTPRKKRYKVKCKHCDRAGVVAPKVFTGRSENYVSHLRSCKYYQATLFRSAAAATPSPPQWDAAHVAMFESLLVRYQHRCHLSDSFIEYEETVMLLEFLCPGTSAWLPTRRQLGGPILRQQAGQSQLQLETSLKKTCSDTGGRVSLLSDVWENIAKQHLLGAQLLLFGCAMTFALDQVGAVHHGIAIAKELEALIGKATANGWTIGAVVTDDAGQCGRARRILALRWPRIAFVRCFAHDVNNLVKQVLRSVFRATARKAATVVNALNASSAKWLRLLHDIQLQEYGKTRAMIALCPTRWNSMQGCFASLLRSKTALTILSCRHAGVTEGWPASLQVLESCEFWTRLEEAEQVIRPLSAASFRLQRDQNTLADVVVSFAEIYRKFAANAQYGEALVSCVEKRWMSCEQPLFMLALYLHPIHAKKAAVLPATDVSSQSRICHFAVYYYRRYIDDDVNGLRDSLGRWFGGMYTTTRPREYAAPVPSFWTAMKQEYPRCKLPVLALTVLSIAVNTATCERLFSELGNIHTPIGNRMDAYKSAQIEAIRENSRQSLAKQVSSSMLKKRRKRIVSPTERDAASDNEEESCSIIEHNSAPTADSVSAAPDGAAHSDLGVTVEVEGGSVLGLSSDENLVDSASLDKAEEEAIHTIEFWDSYLKEVEIADELADADSESPSTAESNPAEVLIDPYEEIPAPDRSPLPEENIATFPQESRLKGIRAYKSSLAELFSSTCFFSEES